MVNKLITHVITGHGQLKCNYSPKDGDFEPHYIRVLVLNYVGHLFLLL